MMSSFKINLYTQKKLPPITILNKVSELDEQLITYFWNKNLWTEMYDSSLKGYYLFVVSKEKCIVGFSLFRFIDFDDLAHLLKLAVIPSFRGTGVSEELMRYAENFFMKAGGEKIYLEVAESNVSAQKFYLKCAFEKIHCSKNFYQSNENAFQMVKELAQP